MPKVKTTKLPSAKEVWDEAKDLTEELVDAGSDEDKAVAAVADFLDAILPLDKLIPGELGELAESADDEIFEKVIGGLADLFKVDPVKRAERRARRKARQEERRERRATRRAERAARKKLKEEK
jgi:hypothetical protein